MKTIARKGEPLDRTQVWLEAWIAVATSSTCVSVGVAANWADNCLKDFDERFPAQPIPAADQPSKKA